MRVRAELWCAVEAILVFLAVAILIGPLFRVKYLDNWPSIESTFIADARFLKDNWPHPDWQPNWYAGTRTDYIYPPALRYGTAALTKYIPRMVAARAYHIYVAFFYCAGIAAVYLLARWGSRSRAAAFLAAAATALISPTFLFVQTIRDDSPLRMPYRLLVLLRYGEGPHVSSLAWIPLALLFSFRSLERWRPLSFTAAAVSCAMVVSHNFYGATSLAMLFPVLVWSVYITHPDRTIWIRAAGIAALSYGLTAFWLVPSYMKITVDNMRFVSFEGNTWSKWTAAALAIGFVWLSYKLVRERKDEAYFTFLAGSTALFSLNTLGNYYFNFRIFGEPARQFPELDCLMILLSVELLRRLWSIQGRWQAAVKTSVALLAFVSFLPSCQYLQKCWTIFVGDPNPTDRLEYQMQDWVYRNMPQSRVLASGTIRFWFNAWHDLPQLKGGSDQGLLNPKVVPPGWEIHLGKDPVLSILWMQILGVDAVLVNGKKSREHYRDHQFPYKFAGQLPVLWDNGADDVIYGVPRRYRSLARVVNRQQHDTLPVIAGNGNLPHLEAWYNNVENGRDSPTETRFEGTDTMHIRAQVHEGESVWVAESFDPNWRATIKQQAVPMREDKLGMMILDTPPGSHEIRLEFPVPFETQAGRVISAISALVAVALVCGGWLL